MFFGLFLRLRLAGPLLLLLLPTYLTGRKKWSKPVFDNGCVFVCFWPVIFADNLLTPLSTPCQQTTLLGLLAKIKCSICS